MSNSPLPGSEKAALEPQNTFLLVQEIVDEENYNRLTRNVEPLHTVCVGGTDKVRLIFSNEPPSTLSQKYSTEWTIAARRSWCCCPRAAFRPPPC